MDKPNWFQRLRDSWASRSLLIGAVATAVDLALGTTLILLLPHAVHGIEKSRIAAMVGTLVGSTVSYFLNRRFAFKDQQHVAKSAWKFVVTTLVLSVVHGQAMVWLRDHAGVPYVPAKVLADLVVFTFTQLVVLRFFVFPQQKKEALKPPLPGSTTPSSP